MGVKIASRHGPAGGNRRGVARGAILLTSRADAEIAQQAVVDVVDPAVHPELLAAPPGVAHHGGVGHAHHLLDDVELAEAIAALALVPERLELRTVLGADVLLRTLARLDELTPEPQHHADATLAPRLKRADGHVDWGRPARELVNLVRGCNPWPGALTHGPAGPLTIWRARAGEGATDAPGTLMRPRVDDELAIATADGWLRPIEVQPEARRAMSWPDYLRGARLTAGSTFANTDASGAQR